jgi:uncharacterized protein (TIGR03437 family)
MFVAQACMLVGLKAADVFMVSNDSLSTTVATVSLPRPFAFGSDIGPLSGAFTVLPGPTAEKYFVVSRSATNTISVLQGRFPLLTVGKQFSAGQEIAAAAVSPDRRRIVAVGSSGVLVYDTESDTALLPINTRTEVGASPMDVAISLDSSRAFVLSAESRLLTAIDLATNQVAGSLSLAAIPTAVTVGPNGLVYVSAQSAIFEIEPRTLTLRSNLGVSGQPGKLQFTPDGRFMVSRNTLVSTARPVVIVDLTTRRQVDFVAPGVSYVDVAVTGNRRAYATGTDNTLYLLTIGETGGVSARPVSFSAGTFSGTMRQVLGTGELPNSRYLILTSPPFAYLLDLESNELSEAASSRSGGSLFVLPTTGAPDALTVLTYGAGQTAAAGGPSAPLVVRVHNSRGEPVRGVSVNFTSATSGSTVANASATTNAEGFASTYVNIPANATGNLEVTASIANGQRTARFTITVGDPGTVTPGRPVRTGLQIYSGQGQVLIENNSTFFQEPLGVRLTDSQGNPVRGAVVNWSLPQGASGSLPIRQSVTNDNGIAEAHFTAAPMPPALPYVANQITATVEGTNESVTFVLVTLPRRPQGITNDVSVAQMVFPGTLRLKAGQVSPGVIQLRTVATATSAPIPYVGVRLVPSTTDLGPEVQCVDTWALSDLQGNVTCDVIAGTRLGTGTYNVMVAGRPRFQLTVEVVPGDPATTRALPGSTPQTALTGTQFQPLYAEVTDVAGNLLPGVEVAWEIPLAINLVRDQITRTTDSFGRAIAVVAAGTQPGVYQVRARAGSGTTAVFNLTVNATPATVTKVDGDAQNAQANSAFARPLTVRVNDDQGRPVASSAVTFTVESGSGRVNAPQALTNEQGIATTTVQAGDQPGQLVIRAAAGSISQVFTLSVRAAGPALTASDILNAGGMQPGISPGSRAIIRARGLGLPAGTIRANESSPLPTRLGDVEVLFNNVLAPLFSVSNEGGNEGITLQVPFEVAPGNATVTIRIANGGVTTLENVPVLPLKPGVYANFDSTGRPFTVALRPDGSFVNAGNPARRGETIRVLATGLGQTTPETGTNRVATSGQLVLREVIAGVNNEGIRVIQTELLENFIGLYLVSVEIPMETATGPAQPFGLAILRTDGQLEYANGTFLPVAE